MKKYFIIGALALLIVAAAAIIPVAPWQKTPDLNDPDTYMGTWVAVEYVHTNTIQTSDFYPDKYLGNHIVLSVNEYYSENFLDYFPPEPVYSYFIKEISEADFYIHTKAWFSELGIEGDTTPTLNCRKRNGEEMLGVINKNGELICCTGTGWYRYVRVD